MRLSNSLWSGLVVVAVACGSTGEKQAGASHEKALAPQEIELIRAAERGDLKTVAALVSAGTDVRCKQRLHEQEKSRVVDDADVPIEGGWDPLMAAACANHIEVVDYLLAAGADPNTREYETSFWLKPSADGDTEVVARLEDLGYLDDEPKSEKGGQDRPRLRIGQRHQSFFAATILINAAERGHAGVVETLLRKGADPRAVNSLGQTALAQAASYGHADVVRALLAAKVDPDQTGQGFGEDLEFKQYLDAMAPGAALHRAAQAGHVEVVRLLLEAGAKTDAPGMLEGTPLSSAAGNGHTEVVKLLLDHGADSNQAGDSFGVTPLMFAARGGHLDAVVALLERGADPNRHERDGSTALMTASMSGRAEVVEALLRNKADANLRDSDGMSAADLALAGGYFDVAEQLRKAGGEIPLPKMLTARLNAAVKQGDVAGVREALAQGADIEASLWSDETPLINAVRSGHAEIVQLLLESGAKADGADSRKECTALGALVGNSLLEDTRDYDLKVARMLLDRGASARVTGGLKQPLLVLALASSKAYLLPMLLDAGADPNAADLEGMTALMNAAATGELEDLRLLVDAGANPNLTDRRGGTALFYALGNAAQLSFLIEKGAKVNVRDESGRTPLDYARRHEDDETIRVLVAAGAK